MFKKEKCIAIFLTKKHNAYSVAKKRRFNTDAKTIRFKKGKSYKIDASQYTYNKGLKLYYFIDTNAGQLFPKGSKGGKEKAEMTDAKQLSLESSGGDKEKAEIIDAILRQSIIKQITSGLSGGFSGSIMNMIMFFGLGLAIGFIIAGFL